MKSSLDFGVIPLRSRYSNFCFLM